MTLSGLLLLPSVERSVKPWVTAVDAAFKVVPVSLAPVSVKDISCFATQPNR